jgi:hypothetical protein
MVAEKTDEIRAPVPRSNTETSNEPGLLSLSFVLKEHWKKSNKAYVKVVDLPTEALETDMLVWTKYAKRLGDKGFKIMESLLLINDPF